MTEIPKYAKVQMDAEAIIKDWDFIMLRACIAFSYNFGWVKERILLVKWRTGADLSNHSVTPFLLKL
jgi:hypothetical protein